MTYQYTYSPVSIHFPFHLLFLHITHDACSNAGISRSSTVALAYMIETERMPLEQAYDRLKLSRPAIQPNPGFMSQLAGFQEQLGIGNAQL